MRNDKKKTYTYIIILLVIHTYIIPVPTIYYIYTLYRCVLRTRKS